jgi:HD-like signal output (HDOD) protein
MYQWMQRLFSGSAKTRRDQPEPEPQAELAPEPAPALAAAQPVVSFEQLDKVNGNYFNWLFEAEGESDLDTNLAETQVLEALGAIIGSQQSGAALVRRLPGLLPQLLQSLRSDNFSGAQLSRTISNDVVLVAAVIRLANSSCRGSGKSITSVEHAVMLIGQQGLRHLITSVAFRPIIDMHSGYYTRTLAPRLWDQSERCAMANRALAESLGIDPFEAFLAGLVQNVGLIVALRIMDQTAKNDLQLGSEIFCARLVRDARILTCSIGREWSFPDTVTQAIGEQAGMRKGRAISPLGRLLTLTDYLSKIRILVENERLSEADPALFDGLPPEAAEGYRALEPIVVPVAESTADGPSAGTP